MAKTDLTAQRLRELLHYNPETGVFIRLNSPHGKWKPGQTVGSINSVSGYLVVGVDKHQHYGHRLAWLYMTGEWPFDEIDHINGVRADNKWQNLRNAPRNINAQNMRRANSINTSGLLGVTRVGPSVGSRRTTEKWAATIKTAGKRKYLGIFDTQEEAHQAYLTEKRRIHDGCTI
jgi:hypothetical protein